MLGLSVRDLLQALVEDFRGLCTRAANIVCTSVASMSAAVSLRLSSMYSGSPIGFPVAPCGQGLGFRVWDLKFRE